MASVIGRLLAQNTSERHPPTPPPSQKTHPFFLPRDAETCANASALTATTATTPSYPKTRPKKSRAHLVGLGHRRLAQDVGQHRDRKRRGLARPRLGDADDVELPVLVIMVMIGNWLVMVMVVV